MNGRGSLKQSARFGLALILLFSMMLNSGLSSAVQAQTGSVDTRVSISSDGTEANGYSDSPVISADGRYVVFQSDATNLVSDDTNGVRDIFVHDTETKTTVRVSVDSSGAEGNGNSSSPSISANGRYIVFNSVANNLVQGDSNGYIYGGSDVFLHDMQTSETKLVSVNSDGIQADDISGGFLSISADGRYVTFLSYATNLVSIGGRHTIPQVYRHDMLTGSNVPISIDTNGYWSNDSSSPRAISADGRYVLFSSYSNNLDPDYPTNSGLEAFVRDVQAGVTTLVAVSSEGIQENHSSGLPAQISADGRYVAFSSDSTNLVPGDTNGTFDAFVHDMQTGATTRVSVNSMGEQGYGHSASLFISADDRYVAFASDASNIVPGDTNGQSDLFVHDMQTGATVRISLGDDCVEENGGSSEAVISADGQHVAFSSSASNLISGDTNGTSDVFMSDNWVENCTTPTPEITLDLPAPTSLAIVNNQYSPNPFDVTATVLNDGTASATNVQLNLTLPIGLTLASGTATQSIGDLAVRQERQVSWSVLASPQATSTILTYTVTATAQNAQPKTLSGQISLPSIASSETVILLHGVNENAAEIPNTTEKLSNDSLNLFRQLADGLIRENVDLEVFQYQEDYSRGGDSQSAMRDNAKLLNDQIKDLRARDPNKKISLIGFSMGAAIIRGYLALYPGAKDDVDVVIFLEGAQQGSWALKVNQGLSIYSVANYFGFGNPTGVIALTGIQNIVLDTLHLNLSRPAATDLTPQSAWYRDINRSVVKINDNELNENPVPPQLSYYNFYGDIGIQFDAKIGKFQLLPSKRISIGDVALLPGEDDPTARTLLGGARFLPNVIPSQRREQWAMPYPFDLDLSQLTAWIKGDILGRDAFNNLITAPSSHLKFKENMDSIRDYFSSVWKY